MHMLQPHAYDPLFMTLVSQAQGRVLQLFQQQLHS